MRYLVFVSPIFTYLLLRYGSGVPILEKKAEEKWGADEKWKKYTKETSVMVPWPAGLGKGKAA
jgi:steroid 5-alpha reductase family enzyme